MKIDGAEGHLRRDARKGEVGGEIFPDVVDRPLRRTIRKCADGVLRPLPPRDAVKAVDKFQRKSRQGDGVRFRVDVIRERDGAENL